jgi:pyruvate dehydrogenase E2 component (dihydrolipoamide acetyltransferase)
MATELTMPKLGLTMDEGTILDWFKDEGDAVRIGEALLSVETDKVSIDVEAPASGILLKIVVLAGKTVPLGEVIAYIGDKGEAVPEKTRLGQESTSPVAPAAESKKVEVISPTTAGPIKVSPIARKLAEENQIDLSAVQGTGPQVQLDAQFV